MSRSVLILVGAGVLACALASGWLWARRTADGSAGSPAQITLGEEHFEFPPGYLRERLEGSAEIAAMLPSLSPGAESKDINAKTNLNERFQRLVFLTLKAANPQLDPADRMARLYERFLAGNAVERPGGLVERGFEGDSPFTGDELIYVPPEGRAFAARCHRPDATGATPTTCMASLRLGGVDVDIRFTESHLAEWSDLMARVTALVNAARR